MIINKSLKYLTRNKYFIILMCLYLIFSISTYSIWKLKNHNNLTGDEPHYLVMANGISKYYSFEQTKPYKEEFITRKIYPPGLNSIDDNPEPSSKNTHAVDGPNGLFNVHNIGLPLLLAIPYKIAGTLGCKVFMILNGGFIIFLLWNIISLFYHEKNIQFLAFLPLVISNPLIFASNQIYPEFPAASISLIGIYWIAIECVKGKSKKNIDWFTFISISFLPWLHIKYTLSLIIILYFMIFILIRSKENKIRIIHLFIPIFCSTLILSLYNIYAFGTITGRYNQWNVYGNNIQLSFKSFTVFLGLLFDQEQGIFLQNPLNLIGLISIGLIFKKNKLLCYSIGCISLSSIFINSLHPAWYGGYSLIGRFGWTGGVVFMLFAIYALIIIGEVNKKLLLVLSSISLFISIHTYKLFTIDALHFYNLENNPNSTRLYNSLGEYLPLWLEEDKVIFHIPNLIFIFLSFLLLYIGFYMKNKPYEDSKILK